MMPSAHNILAAASTASVLLLAGSPAAVGASAAPPKLTKLTAAAAALKDAKAGATISGGDKVLVSKCLPYGRSTFKCSIVLAPQSSATRCHWTDTIRLIKGKFDVQYSRIVCSG